ncbi:MAG: diacylglycerol kinase family lipid kinase [Bacteroidales bacterium]|nr:diacylglycerol kinase family lipid kinase [Bacteroidales bacterium]
MTEIRFIVNPISGGIDKKKVIAAIEKYLDGGIYHPEILFTEKAGDATRMARETQAELVVAVGGDGTVSEVARGLVHSDKCLGVIPCGSGDGLALHLGISRNPVKAVQVLNEGCRMQMDVARMNGTCFFCTAGLGLDASVSLDFAKSKRRGLGNYISLAWKDWHQYPVDTYTIELETPSEVIWSGPAVFVTIANANQWGNMARIAPMASLRDGLLDVVVVHPFSALEIPDLATRLMVGKADTSRRFLRFPASKVHITRTRPGAAHCDGDPFEAGTEFDLDVLPGALNVMIPRAKAETL